MTTPTRTAPPAIGLTLGFLVAAVLVAGLAVRAPIPVSVFGLAIFGFAHVALEVRYVIGRFASAISGTLGWALVLVLTLIVGTRYLAMIDRTLGHRLESVGAFALLALAVWLVARGLVRVVGLAVIALGLAACLVWPAWYWHVITHLHNLVPVVFLADWARRLPAGRQRNLFLVAQLGWVLVVPALILSGSLDGLLSAAPGAAAGWVGTGASVVAAAAPPGASAIVALRYATVFAFGQSMHYLIWIGFFPLFAPDASRAFARTLPALRGWRLPTLVIVGALALAAAFWTNYSLGRQIYSMVAAYHVYLEFPILVFLLLGASRAAWRPDALRPPSPPGSDVPMPAAARPAGR